ncbi:MAG TPA: EAL domain-containing protein [Acetobacteraceae bacterium]|nr:EAL domain-containing protein [Acetobacteraceae bacterium]
MLSFVGLILLGGLSFAGYRAEAELQRQADTSSFADSRFSRAMASIAEARQAETAFLGDKVETQAALHAMALNHAQEELATLLQRPGLSDGTRRGALALSKAIESYESRAAESIEVERKIGRIDGDGLIARLWTMRLDVRNAAQGAPGVRPLLQQVWDAQQRLILLPTPGNGAALLQHADALATSVHDLPLGDSQYEAWLSSLIGAYAGELRTFAQAHLDAAAWALASAQAFQEAWAMGTAGQGIASGQAEFARAEVSAVHERTYLLVRVAIASIGTICAVLAWLLGRGISRPLTHVAEATRRLSRGDRKLGIAYGNRRDEIGEVARALAAFRDALVANEAASERIYRLAHYDELTGAVNRAFLNERMDSAIAEARVSGAQLAVLCLDLDGFKAVNDLHGHAAGDQLLRVVAERLSKELRETDVAARLGGDEFAVVQHTPANERAVQALANRLIVLAAEPVEIRPGITVSVTTSIGIAVYPRDGEAPETLLRNADTALYQAKAAGKGCVTFFEGHMDDALRDRRVLEADLEHALDHGELAIVWQPIASAPAKEAIVGFEVLLRWNHPERGEVPPEVFIPIAEASGAIVPIGEWVLRTACREAARWPNPLWVAVNVSPIQVQLGASFGAMVERAIAETGLDPRRLTLEVTEGVLLRQTARVQEALRGAKALGVRIALDDFGTGYSSLATLRAFPFDKVKIDRSFILGMMQQDQDRAIVRAVIGLAGGLGLPIVAEGVETAGQLHGLAQEGCNEVQGWFIGRPEPIDTYGLSTGREVTRAAA